MKRLLLKVLRRLRWITCDLVEPRPQAAGEIVDLQQRMDAAFTRLSLACGDEVAAKNASQAAAKEYGEARRAYERASEILSGQTIKR